MRGKPTHPHIGVVPIRNIPAYAGKTLGVGDRHKRLPEHPRVCGENIGSDRYPASNAGTSPRMRGKLCYRKILRRCARNIPAYAGKTRESLSNGKRVEEHPRVCGENVLPASGTCVG